MSICHVWNTIANSRTLKIKSPSPSHPLAQYCIFKLELCQFSTSFVVSTKDCLHFECLSTHTKKLVGSREWELSLSLTLSPSPRKTSIKLSQLNSTDRLQTYTHRILLRCLFLHLKYFTVLFVIRYCLLPAGCFNVSCFRTDVCDHCKMLSCEHQRSGSPCNLQ